MLYQKSSGDTVPESGAEGLAPTPTVSAAPKLDFDDLPDGEAMVRLRRQMPMGEPLPITFRWIAKLPRRVRPFALLRQ